MTYSVSRSEAAGSPDVSPSDEELMMELAHGQHEALGGICSRYSRLVFDLALQSLERSAAEELVQEVFLAIWRGAASFEPEQGRFRFWLLGTVLTPVAATLFGLGFAVVGFRAYQSQTTLDRDQRAVSLVTMSDVAARRLAPVMPGLPSAAHAVYRGRIGSSVAVLSAGALPPPAAGKAYQAWALGGGQWTSLGTVVPDANGSALLIAENSALVSVPEAVEITLEPDKAVQTPGDSVVLRWQPA